MVKNGTGATLKWKREKIPLIGGREAGKGISCVYAASPFF
jgi:hypothetical protein